ncbi:MAG: N-acetylmuramic acid 6-phosphate etherase [Firmicutes bacterium]|nr:N-acetylmuramic acid 6-phosphate etherase [Candidatus Fermentithermobacillaceae bacterium]
MMTTRGIPRTEWVNPLTKDIDTWPAEKIVSVINAEDHRVAPAVATEIQNIAKAAEWMAETILLGGRVFYVGAGTSGRIGVLDASELEPTYGSIGKHVIAIMSGGEKAISKASEGSEDSREDGAREIVTRKAGPSDMVIGIASSGRTPFVAGALAEARKQKAKTVAIVGDTSGPVAKEADLVIAPQVGPEVVAGSTRMKNGTAQKLVLNTMSTAAMIIAGRTYSNLMAGTSPRNTKLAGRALRILTEATGRPAHEVERVFAEAQGAIGIALIALASRASVSQASALLEECGGAIRKAVLLARERYGDGSGDAGSDTSPAPPISPAMPAPCVPPEPSDMAESPVAQGGIPGRATSTPPALPMGQAQDVGLDPAQVEQAFGAVARAVGDGEGPIPGAVATIVHRGVMLYPRAFGWAVRTPERIPATPNTMFDLASLTKVTATLPAILKLLERGVFRLDDPLSLFIPEFGQGGKEAITIRQLLTHTSGLPAHVKFYEKGLQGEEVVEAICALSLAEDEVPGEKVVYSDLGFIMLGEMVKRITGVGLDEFVAKEVLEPLGMKDTCFTPDLEKRYRIAATEYRPDLGRVMWGEVHDENAFSLGGVCGHAGLFGTVYDLARYALMWLGGGTLDGVRVLGEATVAAAITEEATAGERRGLGWQLRSKRYSSGGDLMSDRAFGHTGFTGTSIWCDPTTGTAAILLTNRVHAGREGNAHIRVRAQFANAVAASVKKQK